MKSVPPEFDSNLVTQQRTLTVRLRWSTPIEYSSGNAPSIPAKPGVYEIIVKLKNNGGKRRYVGESDNLYTRFSQHLQDNEPKAPVIDNLDRFARTEVRLFVLPKFQPRGDTTS